jgi:hypothetical protein
MTLIPTDKISLDPTVHTRTEVDPKKVKRYTKLLKKKDFKFPPIVVYFDGEKYWIADGYHRVSAHIEAGKDMVEATVNEGDSRDAFLAGLAYDDNKASKSHDDRKACLAKLLADPEWSKWSSSVLALKCGLSRATVDRHRPSGKRLGADGKEYNPSKRKKNSAKTGRSMSDLSIESNYSESEGNSAKSGEFSPPAEIGAEPAQSGDFDTFEHAKNDDSGTELPGEKVLSEESAYKVAKTEDASPQGGQKGDFDDLDQELLEMAEEKGSSDDEFFDTSDGIFNGTTSEDVKIDPSVTVEDVIKSSGVKPANWKEPPAPKEDLLDSGDLALVAEAVSHCRDMWVRRVLEKIGKHSDPMVRGMAEVGLERHENLLSSPEPEKDKRRDALPELWLDTLYEMAICKEDERVLGVLKRILRKLHE